MFEVPHLVDVANEVVAEGHVDKVDDVALPLCRPLQAQWASSHYYSRA